MSINRFEEMTALELDVIKEVGSIGTASAATALSGVLNKQIRMSIPDVSILGCDASIKKIGGPENIVAAILVRMSGDMKGCMLFILKTPLVNVFFNELFQKNLSDLENLSDIEISALNEIGNIMISSYVNALSSLLNISIDLSVPSIAVNMLGGILTVPFAEYGYVTDTLLTISGNFIINGENYDSDILMLPEIESLNFLMKRLGIISE